MQRTIKSFFQPKPGMEVKHKEKVKPEVIQNCKYSTEKDVPEDLFHKISKTSNEADSPVKSIYKKRIHVIESDSDEEQLEEGKETALNTTHNESSESIMSSCSSHSVVSSDSPEMQCGIPKRKTARKQLPKRKKELETSVSEDSEIQEATPKRQRKDCDHEPSGKENLDSKEEETSASENAQLSNITKTKRESEHEEELECKQVMDNFDSDSSREKNRGEHSTQPMCNTSEVKSPLEKNHGVVEDAFIQRPVTSGKAISSFFAPRQPQIKPEKEKVAKMMITDQSSEKNAEIKKESVESTMNSKSVKEQDDYNPSKCKYHVINDACWNHGQKVPYLAVARTFEQIEKESARLKNVETLSNFLRSVTCLSPEDFLPCIYLSLNCLGPAYEGLELGIGETILMKAIAQATGRQLDKIKTETQEKGDLGLVAECSRSNQRIMFKPPNLTAFGVFNKLKEIAKLTGNASMNKKIDIIKGLFVACRHSEARFITRSLGGKLRIGLAEQSVISAVAQAVCLTPPCQVYPPSVLDAGKGMSSEARKAWIDEKAMILKQTFCELPNYDIIIPVLLEHGIENLPNYCRLTPGVPLKPMLAHPTKGIEEVLKRFDEASFTCEYKYDGERAQIHMRESGEVHIYSRNQENNTSKYPDIISRVPKIKKESVKSFILDTEAVAWDPVKKQIQPFQVLTTRKRKDVDAAEIKVQVCIYAFDILYLNGTSLVKEPFLKRRQLLRDSFLEAEGEFMFATFMDSSNTDEISEFLEQSIKDSCEGLMVKTLEKDATYEIAKRSHNWLKLKKDYLDGVGDTLDLVVIGAYLGKGKRTGLYGGFLLASYDEESEEYQTICKIGTGFTDEDLEAHYNLLKDHVIEAPRSYYRLDSSMQPDHWFHPVQVWEVKCADLSISPVHKAALGIVDDNKGISLRFPRFVRIRDDKKPEEATNSFQVAELYKKQQQIQNTSSTEKGEEDFY
uniref:DNA ligase n=1 Tax=Leptobrachium leishanense TaxID=445787 RepID=A0A8C5PCT0_9ANUR